MHSVETGDALDDLVRQDPQPKTTKRRKLAYRRVPEAKAMNQVLRGSLTKSALAGSGLAWQLSTTRRNILRDRRERRNEELRNERWRLNIAQRVAGAGAVVRTANVSVNANPSAKGDDDHHPQSHIRAHPQSQASLPVARLDGSQNHPVRHDHDWRPPTRDFRVRQSKERDVVKSGSGSESEVRSERGTYPSESGARLGYKVGVRMHTIPHVPPPLLAVRVKAPATVATPHDAGAQAPQPIMRKKLSLGERVEQLDEFLDMLDMTKTEGMRRSQRV